MRFLEFFSLPGGYEQLVPSLLHTLWQAASVGLLLAMALTGLPAARARLRYAVSLAALLAVVVGWLATWSILEYRPLHVEVVKASQSAKSRADDTADRKGTEPVGRSREEAFSATHRAGGATAAKTATRLASDAATTDSRPWRTIVGRCWLLGVALMGARLMILVMLARNAGHANYSLDDPRIHEAFARLRNALRIVRRVRLGVSKFGASPAVYGAIWPMVLLPAAILGQLSAEQLRFVLAHELAHIRRHDYLVNLVQLGIEALLFFNPAVWWISRQIRLEREACCDALAIRVTGNSVDYARALVECGERFRASVFAPAAALAFAASKRPLQLRDRVGRILFPGYRPAPRVSPLGLCGLIVIGGLALAGLSKGTGVAVAFAVEIMNPTKRVERTKAAEAQFGPEPARDDVEMEINGVIQAEDGSPLPRNTRVIIDCRHPNASATSFVSTSTGKFKSKVRPGEMSIWALAPGYAVRSVGPLEVRADSRLDTFHLILKRSPPGHLHVTDAEGHPIAKAEVQLSLRTSSSSLSGFASVETDAAGTALVDPLAISTEPLYSAFIIAHGFQDLTTGDLRITDTDTPTVAMPRARPLAGVAIYGATGQPAAGATVKLQKSERKTAGHSHSRGADGSRLMAVCDEQGRFVLDTLEDHTAYNLIFCGTDGSRTLLDDVKAGGGVLRVELNPPLVVRGKVIAHREGEFKSINFLNEGQERSEQLPVKVREGIGYFELTGLLRTRLRFFAQSSNLADIDLTTPPAEVVLDLTRPAVPKREPNREVILAIEVPPGSPPASGKVFVYLPFAEPHAQSVELVDGVGRAKVFASDKPIRMHCESRDMIGYWFPSTEFDVPAGMEPFRQTIQGQPAGAIYGTLAWPYRDREPDIAYTVFEVDRPTGLQPTESYNYDTVLHAKPKEHKFIASPLPLEGSYIVLGRQGATIVLSDVVRLDATNPLAQIELAIGTTIDGQVKVIDADGKPLADVGVVVECSFNSGAQHSFGTSVTRAVTDPSGRFTLARMNSDAALHYSLRISQPGYETWQLLDWHPGGEPLAIALQPGHTLKCKVVDDATNEPVNLAFVRVTKSGVASARRNSRIPMPVAKSSSPRCPKVK